MDTGGQAFPSKEIRSHFEEFEGISNKTIEHDGMTLQDYFAGQALTGLLASIKTTKNKTEKEMIEDFSGLSYAVAEGMLKERSRCSTTS